MQGANQQKVPAWGVDEEVVRRAADQPGFIASHLGLAQGVEGLVLDMKGDDVKRFFVGNVELHVKESLPQFDFFRFDSIGQVEDLLGVKGEATPERLCSGWFLGASRGLVDE